jgi:type 1 glutamine amidotransferase
VHTSSVADSSVNNSAAKKALAIVSGDDIHHDLLSAVSVFQTLCTEAGLSTTRAAGLQRFIDPKPVTAEADVYVLYTSGGQFSTDQQRALSTLVAAGKGVVAIHASNVLGTAPDGTLAPADRPMYELLGNRYLSHGPGHHEGRFTVHPITDHDITRGVPDFELFDEYYEFEFADDDVHILAERERTDGTLIPVLYTREVGAGRVCYFALGHDMRSWGEPPFRTIVRQAIAWAARL